MASLVRPPLGTKPSQYSPFARGLKNVFEVLPGGKFRDVITGKSSFQVSGASPYTVATEFGPAIRFDKITGKIGMDKEPQTWTNQTKELWFTFAVLVRIVTTGGSYYEPSCFGMESTTNSSIAHIRFRSQFDDFRVRLIFDGGAGNQQASTNGFTVGEWYLYIMNGAENNSNPPGEGLADVYTMKDGKLLEHWYSGASSQVGNNINRFFMEQADPQNVFDVIPIANWKGRLISNSTNGMAQPELADALARNPWSIYGNVTYLPYGIPDAAPEAPPGGYPYQIHRPQRRQRLLTY